MQEVNHLNKIHLGLVSFEMKYSLYDIKRPICGFLNITSKNQVLHNIVRYEKMYVHCGVADEFGH